jgi:hypothetical protein
MYHCKKCGHHLECAKKEDWLAEKKEHKRRGCNLEFAPHKDGYILTRPQLAKEARKGKEMVAQQLSQEDNDNPTNQQITRLSDSPEDTEREECTI